MKITDIEVIHLRVPKMEEECEWGDDALLVKVHTDEGIIGLGESDTSPMVAKAIIEAPSSNLHSNGLRRLLIGENPLEIQRLWDKMYCDSNYLGRRGAGIHAMSAIDIALWDIASQYYGVPIHMLLGGKYRDKIRVYGTFYTADTLEGNKKIVAEHKELGFTSLKFGCGIFGDDPDMDVELVRAVREEAGEDFEIAIDVETKWGTYGNAVTMFKRMEPFHLNWIEEPVLADDMKSYARLSGVSPVKIAGGERLATRYEFSDFMTLGQPDIVQPDVTRCGGISELRRINDIAEMQGCKLVPHGYSTGILLAASVQFLAATKNGDLMEYSRSTSPMFNDLVKNLIQMENGYINVPDCIGLGVELDEDVIERYRV